MTPPTFSLDNARSEPYVLAMPKPTSKRVPDAERKAVYVGFRLTRREADLVRALARPQESLARAARNILLDAVAPRDCPKPRTWVHPGGFTGSSGAQSLRVGAPNRSETDDG